MAINVKDNQKDSLKIEILNSENTLAGALTQEMWNDKNTKVSGYNVKHSLADNPVLIVKGKDAKNILLDSISRYVKRNKEFLSEFKKSIK